MDHEIPGRIAGYTEMNPHRPDPWQTSAAARNERNRAEIVRYTTREAERGCPMPDDEQDDAEPAYVPRSGAGACAGTLIALVVFGAFCACGAWALVGLMVGGGRP